MKTAFKSPSPTHLDSMAHRTIGLQQAQSNSTKPGVWTHENHRRKGVPVKRTPLQYPPLTMTHIKQFAHVTPRPVILKTSTRALDGRVSDAEKTERAEKASQFYKDVFPLPGPPAGDNAELWRRMVKTKSVLNTSPTIREDFQEFKVATKYFSHLTKSETSKKLCYGAAVEKLIKAVPVDQQPIVNNRPNVRNVQITRPWNGALLNLIAAFSPAGRVIDFDAYPTTPEALGDWSTKALPNIDRIQYKQAPHPRRMGYQPNES